jgi:hypothetical protein
MKRVLFSQLKVGQTYYEYYSDSRDKFLGFDGYLAIFEEHIFFAYKKCKFYEMIPYKVIIEQYQNRNSSISESVLDQIDIDSLHMNESDRQFFV